MQQMKQYDLNLLVALDALLELGSVTAAAKRLHLSTPAMSHALGRLREVFGDELLVRAGRRMVATPRGRALAALVHDLVVTALRLPDAGSSRPLRDVHRTFVIRAPDGIALVFGPTLVEAMVGVMPQASVQFVSDSADEAGGLRDGRIDLDVGAVAPSDPEVRVKVLRKQPLVGVARRGHGVLASRLTPRQFAEAAHVAVGTARQRPSAVDAALARLGLRRVVKLWVPHVYAAIAAAARSQLVASVPERIARKAAPALGAEVFVLPLTLAPEPLLVAWHPQHERDAAHAWLRAELVRQLSQAG
jgi:DNA-binding transcriptional LysR family regulator